MTDPHQKPVRFRCPHCEVILKGNLSDAGQERTCPRCRGKFKIPRPVVREQTTDAAKAGKELVPVTCQVCQTRMYATIDDVGKSIECPDCFTQTLVQEPSELQRRSAVRLERGFSYDVEPEKELAVKKSLAEDLLDEADKVVERKIEQAPKIPDRPFVSGVFFYPFYWRIFPVVLGMALAWALVFSLAKFAWDLQGHGSLVAPFFFAATGIVLLMVFFPTLVTLQKVFENTSNGDEYTDCRPEGGLLAFIDWIGDVIPLMVAFALSFAPGMTIMKTLGLGSQFYLAVAFSTFLLFPIILMSILESASIAGFFSKPVWTSFAQIPWIWIRFYLISVMLLALGGACGYPFSFLAHHQLSGTLFFAGAASLFGVMVFATSYFRLLGRLAFVMSQKLEVEVFEPDDEYDADLGPTAKRNTNMSLGV